MLRKLSLLMVLPLLVPVACDRQPVAAPATARRPLLIPPPTKEEAIADREERILKDLDPLPALEGGKVFEAPDGEKWVRYSNDMMIHDLKRTNAAEAMWGQTVAIAYTLTLATGSKVIDKKTANDPLTFVIGTRGIIKGMNIGVMGMTVGGRRRIFVPPELGYGKAGSPSSGIGPESALIFEVELVSLTGNPIAMPAPKTDLPPPAEQAGPPAPTPPATAPGSQPAHMKGPASDGVPSAGARGSGGNREG